MLFAIYSKSREHTEFFNSSIFYVPFTIVKMLVISVFKATSGSR